MLKMKTFTHQELRQGLFCADNVWGGGVKSGQMQEAGGKQAGARIN